MTFFVIAPLAICAVLAFLVTLLRIVRLSLVLSYATFFDVAFTVALFIVFQGTLAGALVATLGGLFMTVLLTIGRKLLGYERFERVTVDVVKHKRKWARQGFKFKRVLQPMTTQRKQWQKVRVQGQFELKAKAKHKCTCGACHA